jgi:DNA repair exonuclease SbcCD ATPase subunit
LQELEKSKRKVEGDLKVANETMDELNRLKAEADGRVKAKEAEYATLAQRLEDEQSVIAKTQRQAKELQQRVTELEEALESERQSRARVRFILYCTSSVNCRRSEVVANYNVSWTNSVNGLWLPAAQPRHRSTRTSGAKRTSPRCGGNWTNQI